MSEDLRAQLARHGKARTAARRKAMAESEAIRALARAAVEAGISKSEIARLAEITRPALDTMLRQ